MNIQRLNVLIGYCPPITAVITAAIIDLMMAVMSQHAAQRKPMTL